MSIKNRLKRLEYRSAGQCTQQIIYAGEGRTGDVKCTCGGVHIIEAVKPSEA